MSVQYQIDRIDGNISSALSAVAEKGVDVPAGSNSDNLASLIASIKHASQAKSATPSWSEQIITPDEGYDYLSQVTVAAIPYSESENVAGGITVTIG